jgi:hypothetical protein
VVGPPTLAGLVLVLLARVGDVLVLAGYRFPVEISRPSGIALSLIAVVLVLAPNGRLRSRRTAAGLLGETEVDRWFPPLLGLGLSCGTLGWLMGSWLRQRQSQPTATPRPPVLIGRRLRVGGRALGCLGEPAERR